MMITYADFESVFICRYYPLYPPHTDVPVDLEHFDAHCRLPANPNLLIIPSDLRCFIKVYFITVLFLHFHIKIIIL